MTTTSLHDLQSMYSSYHQHPTNKAIHWICMPFALFSMVGVCYSIPFPLGRELFANWAIFICAALIANYWKYSKTVFVGFALLSLLCITGNDALLTLLHGNALWLFSVSLLTFSAAWTGLMVGHKIEGKMPPTFQGDFRMLIYGPTWYLCFWLKKWGIPY